MNELPPPPVMPKVPRVTAAIMPYHRQVEALLQRMAQWVNTSNRLPTASAAVEKRDKHTFVLTVTVGAGEDATTVDTPADTA